MAVAFALQGQHRVGAGLDAAVDHAREVDAQEGELGIGHGVDQVPHQVVPVGPQLVVLAAERHDLQPRLDAAQPGDAIGLQAGAVHQRPGAHGAAARLEDELARAALHPVHAGADAGSRRRGVAPARPSTAMTRG